MIDNAGVEVVLRQVVPAFYLFCCIYLGVELGGRTRLRYTIAFGGIGAVAYIVLNEPSFIGIYKWVSPEMWMIVTLVVMLFVGIWLFRLVLEKEGADGPLTKVKAGWQWLRGYFSD